MFLYYVINNVFLGICFLGVFYTILHNDGSLEKK